MHKTTVTVESFVRKLSYYSNYYLNTYCKRRSAQLVRVVKEKICSTICKTVLQIVEQIFSFTTLTSHACACTLIPEANAAHALFGLL